ncbi:MAG TPA: RluA family pseudouridine synthase [Oligoflexia bacterium]|nr:RluA family pseudouridine synthase [Oligoflexia bacterium]HMP27461.1 RluA family pseudouridine synthase [Oligoflexia bacterium]
MRCDNIQSRIDNALTSRYRSITILNQNDLTENLQQLLTKHFPEIDSNQWERRTLHGGLYVNGIPKRLPSALLEPLPFPCKVEYYNPKYSITEAADFFPSWQKDWIVFEDPWIMVVFKPKGLPTSFSREQSEFSLRAYVENYLQAPAHFPSRLDTSTAGLLAVSKTNQSHHPLQQLYQTRAIRKIYLAAISQTPNWNSLTVIGKIGKSPRHPILREIRPDGASAQTLLQLAQTNGDRALLIARPLSGRTHQIRVHLASIELPIVGDNFYGGEIDPELNLLAYQLTFKHPMTGTIIDLQVPKNFLPNWSNKFNLKKLNTFNVL